MSAQSLSRGVSRALKASCTRGALQGLTVVQNLRSQFRAGVSAEHRIVHVNHEIGCGSIQDASYEPYYDGGWNRVVGLPMLSMTNMNV